MRIWSPQLKREERSKIKPRNTKPGNRHKRPGKLNHNRGVKIHTKDHCQLACLLFGIIFSFFWVRVQVFFDCNAEKICRRRSDRLQENTQSSFIDLSSCCPRQCEMHHTDLKAESSCSFFRCFPQKDKQQIVSIQCRSVGNAIMIVSAIHILTGLASFERMARLPM